MSGQKGLFRYGLESSEGVPWHDYTFSRFESETLKMDRPNEPDPNLDPSGNETEGQNLKAEGKGKLTIAPNSESLLQMRAHHHGFYAFSAPTAGVGLWELRDFDEISDDPLTHYVGSLHAGIWRDADDEANPTEYAIMGMKAVDFTATVDANKNLKFEHDFLFLRDRYMANPTEHAVNAAWTGDMFSRGHRQAGDENGDRYKFKITVPGALGTAKGVWGKGATYGTTEYTTAALMDIRNPDDTLAGTRLEPLKVMIVAGGVFTDDDEFYIEPTQGKPTAVYSDRPLLTADALELRFSLDGGTSWITRVIKSFSLKMGQPREAKFSVGSKYAGRIGFPAQAKRYWEASFSRDYVDRTFERALISQTTISAYAKFFGMPIGSTGYEDFAEFTLDRMKLSAAGATVTTPGDLPETITMRAFSVDNSPLCVERYQNTIASIEPTA